MLLAEDRLDILIERLRDLGTPDRRAILRRLSPAERRHVQTALRAPVPAPEPISPYCADIAARIARRANDSALTTAGREALARAVGGAGSTVPAASTYPASSLTNAAFGWLRRERG